MKFVALALACIALASPALAQTSDVSAQSVIAVMHKEAQTQADQLTLTEARLLDAQQQITDLKAQLSAKSAPVTKPNTDAVRSRAR